MIYKKLFKERVRRWRGGVAAAAYALALFGPWTVTDAGAALAPPARSTPAGSTAQGNATSGKPALWRTYDMLVNFQNLPRTYTCDELWYEFHGILLRLGAWPYSINILPYHCSPSPRADMRSPSVQVRFQLPFFVHGEAVKWASAHAIERTVQLSPGEPKTLQPADCQLLQQIDQTLLASIPVQVSAEHFDCSGPPRRAANFKVAVSLPMAVKMPSIATTSAPAPH